MTVLALATLTVASISTVVGLLFLSYPFLGYLNGYIAARTYRLFRGAAWIRLALCSVALFPGMILALSLLLNAMDSDLLRTSIGESLESSTLVYLQLFINVPSTFVGTYLGLMADQIELPTKQNRVKREIPALVSQARIYITIAISGLIPFVALCVQIANVSTRFG